MCGWGAIPVGNDKRVNIASAARLLSRWEFRECDKWGAIDVEMRIACGCNDDSCVESCTAVACWIEKCVWVEGGSCSGACARGNVGGRDRGGSCRRRRGWTDPCAIWFRGKTKAGSSRLPSRRNLHPTVTAVDGRDRPLDCLSSERGRCRGTIFNSGLLRPLLFSNPTCRLAFERKMELDWHNQLHGCKKIKEKETNLVLDNVLSCIIYNIYLQKKNKSIFYQFWFYYDFSRLSTRKYIVYSRKVRVSIFKNSFENKSLQQKPDTSMTCFSSSIINMIIFLCNFLLF